MYSHDLYKHEIVSQILLFLYLKFTFLLSHYIKDYNPRNNIFECNRNLQFLQFQPTPTISMLKSAKFKKKLFQNQHYVQGRGEG